MTEIISLLNSARGIAIIVLFLGGSIFVHELGHFLAAKWRGLRVERFSIGFGPRVFGWKGKDGVDYRISLLPLGGYVALPQLADMEAIEGKSSLDKQEPLPQISYFDKLVVFAAGAFFNIIFALLCAFILWGIKIPTTDGLSSNAIGHVERTLEIQPGESVPAPAFEAGIKPGERIISIDGNATPSFDKIVQAIALGTGRDSKGEPQAILEVQSEKGEIREVTLKPVLVSHNPRSGDFIRMLGISPIDNLTISPVDNYPAAEAGIKNGDKLLACDMHDGNGALKIYSIIQLNDILEGYKGNKISLQIQRGEQKLSLDIKPKIVPFTRELGLISFNENGKKRSIKLIATPQNLEDFSETAPRNTLRILNALPYDSENADILVTGATIDGISTGNSGIKAVQTPQDLLILKNGKAEALTLFLTLPNGNSANVALSDVEISDVPAKTRTLIGIALMPEKHLIRKTPWQQFSDVIDLMVSSIGGLINPKSDIGVGHLNSVITISETYYRISYDIRSVLGLTVLLNINLAFLNLLPIPILDGGHILIATIQRLRRKKISTSIVNGIQYIFLLALLFFMGFILLKDFSRFRGNSDLRASALVARHEYVILQNNAPEKMEVPATKQEKEK